MGEYIKNIDERTIRIIELLALLGGLVWAAAFLRADVNDNTLWNERQDVELEVHQERARQIYMRKDVAAEQYRAITNQLNRIEKILNEE